VSEQDAFKDGREQGRRDCAAEIARLCAERDKLLAALKTLVESDNPILEDWANACAAIAAVEGKP
jgi:hypothetical protein